MRSTAPLLALLAALLLAPPALAAPSSPAPPAVMREFRGVWVATVRNIDWPSKPGLSTADQQKELIALLDRAVALRLNGVVLQVRPACDALYASRLEPWSEYLTGRMGQPPVPFYDPLAFAVAEAHRRGLELHAWFNPYRARLLDDHGGADPASADHVSVAHPELVRRYGHFLWLDPGEPAVQAHSLAVMLDVVSRYDIDAVHMDDYFYPYREPLVGPDGRAVVDEAGKPVYQPFPDEESFKRYQLAGGTLTRDDWRRANVDGFVRRLYDGIKAIRPTVKLGISPFGIWKPGFPEQIKGMSQYDVIFADARRWLSEGWVDYFTPQLYWSIANPDQSYPVLLRWWAEQNDQQRHLWPGLFTSRVADGTEAAFQPSEVPYQIQWTRLQPGATGHVHFSMKALLDNRGGVADRLLTKVYADPALVPATPWLDAIAPDRPVLMFTRAIVRERLHVTWRTGGPEPAWLWVAYLQGPDGAWSTRVLPGGATTMDLDFETAGGGPMALELSAVDRSGNESAHARAVFQRPSPAPVPQVK